MYEVARRCRRRIASDTRRSTSAPTGTPAVSELVNATAASSASTRRPASSADAVDLLERALGMVAACVEPEPPRRGETDHDHHDLVVAQHQRRQPVTGLEAIPAADATLALDRDPELLQVVDVAPDRAAVDPEVVRDLAAAHDRAGLEQLEDLEQP